MKAIRKKFYKEEEFMLMTNPSNKNIRVIKVDVKNHKVTLGYTYMMMTKIVLSPKDFITVDGIKYQTLQSVRGDEMMEQKAYYGKFCRLKTLVDGNITYQQQIFPKIINGKKYIEVIE